jgi:predicted nucleic acid-binding protein
LFTPWISQRTAATSSVVYAEVSEYFRGFPDFPQRVSSLRRLLKEVHPYLLTYPILDRYGAIRRHLRPRGGLIGDIDTLIAATALERGLTVVTVDSDFQRVPGLHVLLLDPVQLRQ